MQEKIDTLISEIEKFAAQSKEEVEGFRIKYFGKKGVLADLFSEMKSIAPEMRKDFGQMVNSLSKSGRKTGIISASIRKCK